MWGQRLMRTAGRVVILLALLGLAALIPQPGLGADTGLTAPTPRAEAPVETYGQWDDHDERNVPP